MADNHTPEQRSFNMSRIRGMNTTPELLVRKVAYTRGLRYRTHLMSLPGRPDMVFPGLRVVVFIDGDFWHGWRYPAWKKRLPAFWQKKIERNRRRDAKNFRRLRSQGWHVVRIWEHEVAADVQHCVDRIENALTMARAGYQARRSPHRPQATTRPRVREAGASAKAEHALEEGSSDSPGHKRAPTVGASCYGPRQVPRAGRRPRGGPGWAGGSGWTSGE